ncbi:hypothetical protein AWC38_SpisGene13244 [Stylophora pistillata]|uniref:XK-related protein n=1 Tax=Stylophora pistillata TaxID=50429 RepID=A0A2B4RZN9_STYPI|nr:hypothetical protein AWC38_SpisGene13244 [Stylophora pistillata]
MRLVSFITEVTEIQYFPTAMRKQLEEFQRPTSSYKNIFLQVLLCGFNPFSAALARLQGFIFCLKNFKTLWQGNQGDLSEDTDDKWNIEELLFHSELALLFEAVLESIPQFILQLYAMSVQQEPVKIIQMISLPVSFLSLAWAFTTADELLQKGETQIHVLRMKHKLLLFLTHAVLLSSRLFAISYFMVSYKWWVIVILTCHSFAVLVAEAICICGRCGGDRGTALILILFFFLNWLRDDWSVKIHDEDNENKRMLSTRMRLFFNVLFAVENIAMILMFYLTSPYSNTWYSQPVTVCVCLFSVIGAVARVTHFRFLTKETGSYSTMERNENLSPSEIPVARVSITSQASQVVIINQGFRKEDE